MKKEKKAGMAKKTKVFAVGIAVAVILSSLGLATLSKQKMDHYNAELEASVMHAGINVSRLCSNQKRIELCKQREINKMNASDECRLVLEKCK